MTFRETFNRRFQRLSTEYVPAVMAAMEERVQRLRTSWDELNRSLANRALPEDRKSRVGRLALDQKASRAGQSKPAGKVAGASNRRSRKRED